MTLSNQTELDVLDDMVGNTPTNAVGSSARYLALFTADPGEAGSLANEITGGSYARVDTAGSWAAAAAGAVSTNAAITFPTATADWAAGGTQVTHWALCNASSGGTIRFSAPLTTARNVLNGDTFEVASGALTLTAD